MDLKERTRQVIDGDRFSTLKKRFAKEGAGCFYAALMAERTRLYPDELLPREIDKQINSQQELKVGPFEAIPEIGRLNVGLKVIEIVVPIDVPNSESVLNKLSGNGRILVTKQNTKDEGITLNQDEGAILLFQSETKGHAVGLNPDGFLGEPGGQEGIEFAQELGCKFTFLLKLRKC